MSMRANKHLCKIRVVGNLWRPRNSAQIVAILLGALVIALGLSGREASAAITHNPEAFSPIDGSGAGQDFTAAEGIALDESTGNVFVTNGNRISIVGSKGGSPVGLSAPYEISGISLGGNPTLAFDNSLTSSARGTLYIYDATNESVKGFVRNPVTQRYTSSGAEIQVTSPYIVSLSVDTNGDLYITNSNFGLQSQIVRKYNPSRQLLDTYDLSSSVLKEDFVRGAVVDETGNLFVADFNQGVFKFPIGSSGEPESSTYSQLAEAAASGVAIDTASDHVYAALANSAAEFDPTSGTTIDRFGSNVLANTAGIATNATSQRIYIVDSGSNTVQVFGPAVVVPTVTIGAASNITGTKATLNGTVDPEGLPLTKCYFEWRSSEESTYDPAPEFQPECEPTPETDSQPHQVSAAIANLKSNGERYYFRLVAENANGIERSAEQTFETVDTVTTKPATNVGKESAVLEGVVRPEGLQYSSCLFEWGLTTNAGFENKALCAPEAAKIGPDYEAHPVSAALTQLRSNTTYKFRLSASNSTGTQTGAALTFTTTGPPVITEVRSSGADQTSATLEATVDPRGFGTTYRFEWGSTTAYGHQVPIDFDPFAGSGTEPLHVSGRVAGLSPGTSYHYRVIANSSGGSSASPDQTVETVNTCGLPEGRCFELVSPRDVGPTDRPGSYPAAGDLHFQAANSPGALVYVSEGGSPSATKGGEVVSEALRGSNGWVSTQLSPPLASEQKTPEEIAKSSETGAVNDELTCSVVKTNQPLTTNPGALVTLENGGENLYLHTSERGYIALTPQTPTNLREAKKATFFVLNLDPDCNRVVFETEYIYPGVPAIPGQGLKLYEWENGDLHSISYVPTPQGEQLTNGSFDAASEDASRVFFSAYEPGGNELGIYVREDGTTTRKISVSETSQPNTEAIFQAASPDGSRVFFLAAAGLTTRSSSVGLDLYEYDLVSEGLTDLTPSEEAGGAGLSNLPKGLNERLDVIGSSETGSRLFFIAQGQLVPGKGKTLVANESDGTYSIYGEQAGVLEFVGTIESGNYKPTVQLGNLVKDGAQQTARVSASGRYLLFESFGNVTGYEGGNTSEVYLYDSEAENAPLTCLSCRSDGRPPVSLFLERLVSQKRSGSLQLPRTLIERAGHALVLFTSLDVLAPGALQGGNNLYEWVHGQVFLIAAEPPGLQPATGVSEGIRFLSANQDGTDLYFTTPQSLTWEEADGRSSIYDARIGGGYPAPIQPATPCNATVEGSCQEDTGIPGSVGLSPATPTFVGPGNSKVHRKKHRPRRHRSAKRRRAKHHRKRHRHGSHHTDKRRPVDRNWRRR